MTFFGDLLDNVGTALNLPEFGLSEFSNNSAPTANTGRVPLSPDTGQWVGSTYSADAYNKALASKNLSQANAPIGGGGGGSSSIGLNLSGGGGSYGGSGGGGGSTGPTAADTRAYYDEQINNLNSLLGLTNTQRDAGLANLQGSFDQQTQRQNDQRTKTMNGYDAQSVQSGQDKQRGVEQVDQFANNSYNSLQRLLQGGNAGNSSVGRELIPYLISKGAGQRRQGVFDQAGKNDQAIASARGDATDQYNMAAEDLGNQRKSQEQTFREGILNKQNELDSQKRTLQMQSAQASGAGYNAARAAGEASQNSINDRMGQLNALFGQYKPTFTSRAMNLTTPSLGQYTVDPAQINANQNLPSESRYYLPQLKKKQEGVQ